MKIWVRKSWIKNLQYNINMKLSNVSEKFNESLSKYDKVGELQQCKKFNSPLLTRIIQLEQNAVTNSKYSRTKTFLKTLWMGFNCLKGIGCRVTTRKWFTFYHFTAKPCDCWGKHSQGIATNRSTCYSNDLHACYQMKKLEEL